MIKFAIAFHRKEGMDHDACITHYREKHGPLCVSTPGMTDHCSLYLQNDVANDGRDDYPSGVTLAWFDDLDRLFSHFSVPAYMPIIRPDELSFSRHDNALVAMGDERVVVSGGGMAQVRVFRFLRAKAESDQVEQFRANEYAPRIAQSAESLGLVGFSRTVSMPVDLPFPPEQVFDGLDEFIFETPDTAQRFLEWEADLARKVGADSYFDEAKSATFTTSATRKVF